MEFCKKDVKIYILSGKAGSGKNTVSDMICDYYGKDKCISLSYSYYLKEYVKRITGWNGSENDKPRELLQHLGIDLIKNKIDNNFLVNRVLQDIEVYSYFYDIIIISDARLKDEIKIPKKTFNNVICIRIDRKNYDNHLSTSQKEHITETELDNYNDFDYVIKNDDYDKLKKDVISILKENDL